ncbi:MAG TPA: D-alanyl-D-alanine carboxypeptidase/D-alanyl-D-alanine-endopeptidase [Ignavibacteriaceae bacterium]|nr:D-alanyl-D-alanine carboxypeptidase/D-alanyl-D-alanine-endopeptidase [Ignavibacteriaceae bacterium]
MQVKHLVILLSVFLFVSISYPQQVTTTDTLPKYHYTSIPEFWAQIDDIFNDPNFNNAQWGVVIQSLETGEYLYKRNEDKLLMPASNLKLFTTAAGLTLLGHDYTYKTRVYSRGELDGSTLKGDIIIQGTGDPTFSGRFYNGDMFKVFNDWADSLMDLGIDEITGNIIGDDNLFDDVGLGTGWAWDYESDWFAAPSSAICFNDNCVDILITVDKEEFLPIVKMFPNTKYTMIMNDITVVPSDSITDINVHRERGTNIVTISGTIRQNDSLRTYVTVNNPTQYAMVVLKDVLEKKGINVQGYAMDIDDVSIPLDYAKTKKLFTYYSPTLKEIVKVINKNSQNLWAEQLLRTIGYEKKHFGSVDAGLDACESVLRDMGINPESLNIVDGSGLSRLNLVTSKQILSVLTYMYKSKNFIPYYNSLPIAGLDGSLAGRLKNTKAENKVRAKTGFIGNVRALSGYAYSDDNELFAFSIIANNFNVPVKLVENIQDLVCLRLANFSRNIRRISGK